MSEQQIDFSPVEVLKTVLELRRHLADIDDVVNHPSFQELRKFIQWEADWILTRDFEELLAQLQPVSDPNTMAENAAQFVFWLNKEADNLLGDSVEHLGVNTATDNEEVIKVLDEIRMIHNDLEAAATSFQHFARALDRLHQIILQYAQTRGYHSPKREGEPSGILDGVTISKRHMRVLYEQVREIVELSMKKQREAQEGGDPPNE